MSKRNARVKDGKKYIPTSICKKKFSICHSSFAYINLRYLLIESLLLHVTTAKELMMLESASAKWILDYKMKRQWMVGLLSQCNDFPLFGENALCWRKGEIEYAATNSIWATGIVPFTFPFFLFSCPCHLTCTDQAGEKVAEEVHFVFVVANGIYFFIQAGALSVVNVSLLCLLISITIWESKSSHRAKLIFCFFHLGLGGVPKCILYWQTGKPKMHYLGFVFVFSWPWPF